MSAYQMTASTLFPVYEELSHVLEPTLLQLDDFISKYHKNDFFNSLSLKQRKDILDEKIRPAYQPFPGLYVSVPVQHIGLSDLSDAIANLVGFGADVQRLIKPDKGTDLSGVTLRDALSDTDKRERIYRIGEG